jgi:hypothetical protein
VIALGNLAGELKASLEAAVRGADLELLLTREPARAFVELERDGALAMLVDIATLGAEQFCKRARGTERLRSVPVIGMSRHPNELGFARVFAWGADDLVPLGAVAPLERRLKVLCTTQRPDTAGFGQAVVAEATTQRRALVGRVLAQAGYDVKFAVDRGAVELYASQAETRLVVISAALGDPRRMIEAAARAGALPTWIVTAEARSVARLASSLSGLDRVAVTSTSGSPEDVLFLANELVFGKGTRRREWRALYATPVAFRARGEASDDYGFSYDASPGGLYVRSLLPCDADEVEVELRLPNRDERVRLTGKVARRFAFGSGAIASAPPGFSVKLEGPPDTLERWADACQKLIAGASDALTNPPPDGRSAGEIAPTISESGLAVPPATLTIESVVAPLPRAVLEDVEKGSDVGELLAATLDEQTLALVGTKPVTIDADTLDVREERPSEIALRIPSELLEEAAAAAAALAAAPTDAPGLSDPPARLPLPAPQSSPDNALAKTAVVDPEKTPLVDPRFDWDSDAKTEVRQSRPDTEAPAADVRQSRPDTEAAAPDVRQSRPDTEAAAPSVRQSRPDTEAAAPSVRQSRPDADAAATRRSRPDVEQAPPPDQQAGAHEAPAPAHGPSAPARQEPSPAPSPAAPLTPAAAPLAPPPVPPRGQRATMIGVAPPALGSAPIAQGGKTQVLPPPRAKAPSSPGISDPLAAPPPVAPADPPKTAAFEPVAQALGNAATMLAAPAFVPPVERSSPAVPSPAEANPSAPSRAALNAAAAAVANAAAKDAVPEAAPYVDGDRVEQPPSGRGKGLLIALIALMAVGGAILLLAPLGKAPDATTQANPEPTPPANPSGANPAEPPVTPTAASPPATEPAPTASAEPAAPGSAATAAATEKAAQSAAAPDHPPIEFDLRKLAADRGVLYVRSSAKARVFVHGTDYGETNSVLVTSCGIRFVRLGHALGNFVEPGSSYVIKCGRINEIAIEPAP